jgi:hypothetical protein
VFVALRSSEDFRCPGGEVAKLAAKCFAALSLGCENRFDGGLLVLRMRIRFDAPVLGFRLFVARLKFRLSDKPTKASGEKAANVDFAAKFWAAKEQRFLVARLHNFPLRQPIRARGEVLAKFRWHSESIDDLYISGI